MPILSFQERITRFCHTIRKGPPPPPDPVFAQKYLSADRLEEYGFQGWVGPEPHGQNPRNSGASAAEGLSGRDVIYGEEVVRLLKSLPEDQPWAMVSSFVNPHDISLYGEASKNLPGFTFNSSGSDC